MKKGFVLVFTVVLIAIISGIFGLLAFTIKNRVNTPGLYEDEKIVNSSLKSISSIIFLELKLVDDYIIASKIENLTAYVTKVSDTENIWDTESSRTKKSLGGFSMKSINPSLETITFSTSKIFDMTFEKNLIIKDRDGVELFTVNFFLPHYQIYASYNKDTKILTFIPIPPATELPEITEMQANGTIIK
ncbi:MAG: hypothetical protein ACRCSK_08440 [Fusobacteriaceae bacterium]